MLARICFVSSVPCQIVDSTCLLRIDVIDKLANAGISTFNIAVDAVDIE
jgi:hypothetical protein